MIRPFLWRLNAKINKEENIIDCFGERVHMFIISAKSNKKSIIKNRSEKWRSRILSMFKQFTPIVMCKDICSGQITCATRDNYQVRTPNNCRFSIELQITTWSTFDVWCICQEVDEADRNRYAIFVVC